MLEKEAEEWCKKKNLTLSSVGYFTSDYCEQSYIAGAEFGYNKANEWHYVKDGKYPKENQLVAVYRVNPLGANIAITNWYDSYKDTKVIAWKEIVLPKEIE